MGLAMEVFASYRSSDFGLLVIQYSQYQYRATVSRSS